MKAHARYRGRQVTWGNLFQVSGSSPPADYAYTPPTPGEYAEEQEQQLAAPAGDTTLVRRIPNYFDAPFKRWADEDAAQHAYNLQTWRLKILQVSRFLPAVLSSVSLSSLCPSVLLLASVPAARTRRRAEYFAPRPALPVQHTLIARLISS